MNELEQKAIAMMAKGKKRRKPVLRVGRSAGKSVRHTKILTDLILANKRREKIYLSTYDVEMFKWTFEQHTKRKVELVGTKYDRLYIIKLI